MIHDFPESFFETAPFADFTPEMRMQWAQSAQWHEVLAGESVYSAGEPATGLYVLIEGLVQLEDPQLASLHEASTATWSLPGTILSKGSILKPFHHRHNVSALANSSLAYLSRERFQELFDEGNPVAFALLDFLVREISGEVRELNGAIHQLLSES